MTDRLRVRVNDPSRVRVTGPLAPFKAGFATELSRQGYTPGSACMLLRVAAHLSRWLAARGLGAHDLSPAQAERFLVERRAAGYTHHVSGRSLASLLAHLRGLGAVPPAPPPRPAGPVEELLDRYRLYLIGERGFREKTARHYASAVRPFLSERVSPQGLDLDRLCGADVSAFALHCARRQSCGTAKHTVGALRSLLGFLHREGLIERPLSGAIPKIASWRGTGLPKGLEPAELRALLASCDRGTAVGNRDFAILTVLARLGLRAGEVAGLELEDIDWRSGQILVRGKGRRTEWLPLPADVGEPITAYLRLGRPASAEGRAVFVRAVAPYRALARNTVAMVVASAARRAGLGTFYAHRLRHTAATEMLRAGATLPEVGQLLRHGRVQTTAIYAKVDRLALGEIARPWPGGAR
jgi:integrase/recombinase XerD